MVETLAGGEGALMGIEGEVAGVADLGDRLVLTGMDLLVPTVTVPLVLLETVLLVHMAKDPLDLAAIMDITDTDLSGVTATATAQAHSARRVEAISVHGEDLVLMDLVQAIRLILDEVAAFEDLAQLEMQTTGKHGASKLASGAKNLEREWKTGDSNLENERRIGAKM